MTALRNEAENCAGHGFSFHPCLLLILAKSSRCSLGYVSRCAYKFEVLKQQLFRKCNNVLNGRLQTPMAVYCRARLSIEECLFRHPIFQCMELIYAVVVCSYRTASILANLGEPILEVVDSSVSKVVSTNSLDFGAFLVFGVLLLPEVFGL